ncbi:RING finger protein 17 isoform X2 [Rhineura floridana]|uniref:RING finger protein 17 isoform X2 n=1 Tax=Rhineura floridana TaxID=261503 RepID=UPI002AC82D2E|nr:RING finger protein 17 isoform X2 [Rhineura floridana]
MASFLDVSPNRRGRAQRKSPFEGSRQAGVPIRRAAVDAFSDLQNQNSNRISGCDSYTSKVTLDFEQKVRLRSLQKYTRFNHQSIKEKSTPTKCADRTPGRYLTLETSTIDMNSKTLQEIDKALEVAKLNFQCLKTTEEMLEHLVTKAKREESKIADVINSRFSDIIASLHSRKRKLETEMIMNTSYYITDVHSVQVSVMQKINNLDAAIKIAREIKATHCLKPYHNLKEVLCSLKMAVGEEALKLDNLKKRTLPRFYLDCEEITPMFENIGNFFSDTPNMHGFRGSPLKLSNTGEEFKSDISSHVNVQLEPLVEEIGTVAPLQDNDACLEGNYTLLQEMTPSFTPKYIPALPQTSSVPDVIIEEIIEDDQEKYPEDTHRKTFLQKQLVPFGPKSDSTELVFVSCVLNPCHFYVRKVSQKKAAVHLEKTLRQFCNNKRASPNDILELGTRIFVKSKEHGIWCRGKIIELIPVQNTNEGRPCGPTKYKMCDIAMIKVFLIDFGHPKALIISGVPNAVVVNPEHVTLEYIVTEDLCLVVRKPDILIEAQLSGINHLALQCSLKDIVPKHSTEGWDRAARTEFLRMVNNKAVLMKVFREEDGVLIVDLMKPPANKISSDMPVSLRDALVFMDLARFRIELSDQPENIEPLQYWSPAIPQEKTEVTIVVSYINSPGDFYIQLIEQGPEFAAFLSKVEEVYKNDNGVGLEILCPILSQPCIAKFEDDGVWYRAQVIGLPGHQEVEVKYVDFGNTAKINVKEMRKIKDEFLALPAKAIRCKLAHIIPSNGANEWSSKSKDRFEELIQDKCMLCFVIEKSQDDVLSVELYESVHVSPKVSWSVNSFLVKEGLASYITCNTIVNPKSHSEVWDPTPEEVFKTEREDLKPGNDDLIQFEDLELDCSKELQVRIGHVVSPSKIFVHLMSSEQILKSLQEKMAVTYFESESEAVQWKIDMNCAAYVCDLNQWQRGQIRRIVSENIVEVFLFDFGITKTMDTVSLRELEQNLKAVKPLAVECSLTDIRPAGGTEQWTATACDVLARYLTGAEVNLVIQESDSSPLPVKIFSKDGGLCTDISEYMIKEGLAFRKKSLIRAPRTGSSTSSLEKLHEMAFQQDSADISQLLAETECTPSHSKPEKDADPLITECKELITEQELKNSVTQPIMVEAYKPPSIPTSVCFSAVVSCVSDTGTIYVIPQTQEKQLNNLMSDIQKNFKCLGLLEPYSWKRGEACVVRAADTMWYRGEVIEVGGGVTRVQYLDYGYIEKIPQCHLYPTVLYADIPPFSIPCQLYKTVPVGNVWQQDAVELLQELLTKRLVEIHIMEQSDNPWGKVSIKLCFAGISLSSFMAYHKHCINEDDDGPIPKLDITCYSDDPLEDNCEIGHEELLMSEVDTPLLPPYISPTLPVLGELFPVKVTHVVSPNEVYITLDQRDGPNQHDTKDRGISWDVETLDQALTWCNQNLESIPFLTDFRKDMPCLAKYNDGFWYRAKLISIHEFSPLLIIVEFVDYGSCETLPTSRLRQLSPEFMQYPAQSFKVWLAGFKPPSCDPSSNKIPYCPEWSMEALWAMMDCFQGKNLYASSLTHSPEHTVFLYEDGRLVHMKLVEMGFAELS